MSSPTKLSFNSPRSPRASPFRRPDSDGLLRSPSTVRDRSESPTKPPSSSLSPEKHNPFVRRPSQLTTGDRPRSPFARPTSRLSIAEPSSRPTSSGSLAPPISFSRHASVTSQTSVEREHSEPPSPSPVARNFEPPVPVDGAPSSPRAPPSPSPLVIPSSPAVAPSSPMGPRSPLLSPNANRPMRPTAQRTVTSSTQATIRAPVFGRPTSRDSTTSAAPRPSFTAPSRPNFSAPVQMATGQYSHLPQSLLRSMRESFEVLDSSNTGAITSASVADMLQQMGMDSSPRAVAAFFPPNTPSTIALGRFLDLLSAPLAELSEPSELAAAFAAFDVDDSGQIDKHELRDALLNTAPEPGAEHMRLSEHEVDAIISQFSARRAFGAKGVFGKELGGGDRKRGEVFRYRDFISNISGSGGADGAEQVAA